MQLKIPDKKLLPAMAQCGLFRGSVYLYQPDMFNVVDWINEQYHEELRRPPYLPHDFRSVMQRKIKEPPKRVGWKTGYTEIIDETQWHKLLYCRNQNCSICAPHRIYIYPDAPIVVEESPVLIAVRMGAEFEPDAVLEEREEAERVRVREAAVQSVHRGVPWTDEGE